MSLDTLSIVQKGFKTIGKRPSLRTDPFSTSFTYNGMSDDMKNYLDQVLGLAEVDTSHRDASVYKWKSGGDRIEAFQGVGGKSVVKVTLAERAAKLATLRKVLAEEGLTSPLSLRRDYGEEDPKTAGAMGSRTYDFLKDSTTRDITNILLKLTTVTACPEVKHVEKGLLALKSYISQLKLPSDTRP